MANTETAHAQSHLHSQKGTGVCVTLVPLTGWQNEASELIRGGGPSFPGQGHAISFKLPGATQQRGAVLEAQVNGATNVN